MHSCTAWRRSAYLAVLSLQLLLSACSQPPAAEQGIHQALAEMVTAIEQRDSGAIGNRLDAQFQSSGSGHAMSSRKDALRLLLAVFYRHRNISVTLTNIDVIPDNMNRNRASASFNALTTGGDGGLLPSTAQLYRVQSEWVFNDEWQMLSLSAKRALEP